MDLGISGRVAIVAGSSSGLGEAVARALAAEGVKLLLCARRPEDLAALAAFLASERASHITGTSIPVDGGRTRGLL